MQERSCPLIPPRSQGGGNASVLQIPGKETRRRVPIPFRYRYETGDSSARSFRVQHRKMLLADIFCRSMYAALRISLKGVSA